MSASNPQNPDPAEIAGRFQIVKKLGAGAFGTVYKAKDKRLERMVAIKTIRLEGLAASQAGFKEMRERFEREAKTAARLKHPGIVTIYDYDFGESQGLSYIAMEFIDGVGLDSIVAASGRLPVARAAALAAQVADALDYAHQHGVVHRDIKPANIMVEADDRVKVTDFGIAKPGDSAEHLTMTGSLLGTPSYMSPEQARGQKLDGRSDLFSLGCVVYEMVAGHKAFRGDSITALLFKILTEEPPPLNEVDPEVGDDIIRVINKAIAKSPEARYQSGREMSQDLLALTRPGYVPTLRSVDTPTLQPPAGEPKTIHSSPTVVADAPGGTAMRAGGTSSTRPASAPALPTVLAPPPAGADATPRADSTARADATGRAAATHRAAPAPPPPKPPAAAAAPRRGPGLGLLLGLGVVGLLVFVTLAAGAWMLYRRWQAAQEAAAQPSPSPTAVAEMATPTPEPATTPVAEATPATASATPLAAATPAATPAPVAHASGHGAGTPREGTAPDTRGTVPPPRGTARPDEGAPPRTADTPAAGGDYSFLNEIPAGQVEGRAAGEELAQKYRAGGSSGINGRRFAARSKVPRDLVPVERPAVATLLHLMFAEQQYQRSNGRYGNLREMRSAGLLRLDVPFQNGVFERRGYRFELRGEAGEFKARAVPLVQSARPFVADDNGYVLVDE